MGTPGNVDERQLKATQHQVHRLSKMGLCGSDLKERKWGEA